MGQQITFSIDRKFNLFHDNRQKGKFESNPDIDLNKVKNNIQLIKFSKKKINEDIYNKFQNFIDGYNQNQKRKDRKINNICNDTDFLEKQQQFIIDFGEYDISDFHSKSYEVAVESMKNYYADFKEKYPDLYITNSIIHLDEKNVHMHLSFVPLGNSHLQINENGKDLNEKFKRREWFSWEAFLTRQNNGKRTSDKFNNFINNNLRQAQAIIKQTAYEIISDEYWKFNYKFYDTYEEYEKLYINNVWTEYTEAGSLEDNQKRKSVDIVTYKKMQDEIKSDLEKRKDKTLISYNKTEAKYNDLLKQHNELKDLYNSKENEYKQKEKDISELKVTITNQQNKEKEINKSLAEKENLVLRLDKEVTENQKELNNIKIEKQFTINSKNKTLQTIYENTKKVTGALNEKQSEIENLKQTKLQYEQSIREYNTEINKLDEKLPQLRSNKEFIEKEIETLDDIKNAKKEHLNTQNEQISDNEEEIIKQNRRLSEINEQKQQKEKLIERLKNKLKTYWMNVRMYWEENNMEEYQEVYDKLVWDGTGIERKEISILDIKEYVEEDPLKQFQFNNNYWENVRIRLRENLENAETIEDVHENIKYKVEEKQRKQRSQSRGGWTI